MITRRTSFAGLYRAGNFNSDFAFWCETITSGLYSHMTPMDRPTMKLHLNMERRNSSTHTKHGALFSRSVRRRHHRVFLPCLMSDSFVRLLDLKVAHRRYMVLMRRMMPRLSERNTVAAAPARIDLLLRLLACCRRPRSGAAGC